MPGAQLKIEHCFENDEAARREARIVARAVAHNNIDADQKYLELTDDTGGVIYQQTLS